ncbi:hypothetical protein ACG33_06085 [Steroidobacter denitrificans]|uniref:Uncharacterized protein n=1 Tax=Steroidobacter denitrificans TaxID=465721 RepID=A0A127FAQ2_STEDE|nr:hypothetical protein ACG33_06085 [Steroidobacter denitrificans]
MQSVGFSRLENDCARFRGHSLHQDQPEDSYFFLAAFFLVAFFLVVFFALVAMIINLHIELVRAQYIHKMKIASKSCMEISTATSSRSSNRF